MHGVKRSEMVDNQETRADFSASATLRASAVRVKGLLSRTDVSAKSLDRNDEYSVYPDM